MIRAFLQGEPDAVTARLPMLMLPAFLGCFLCVRLETPGLLSCVQIAAYAVSAAMFTEFRVERGLWMLATLFFLVWAGLSLLGLYAEIRDLFRGVAPAGTLLVDAAIATSVIQGHTKYLWKLIFRNLSISRQ